MDKPFDIGIILKPQGIGGELRVFPVTDDPERFFLLDEVSVQLKNKTELYPIEAVRIQNQLVILKLKNIDNRDAAQRLTGGILKIPADKALPVGEDEYYFRDLIGMEVLQAENEPLGVLSDVLRTGANDVYVVTTRDGNEILLPAIKSCILSVSVPKKQMVVRVMEGLT